MLSCAQFKRRAIWLFFALIRWPYGNQISENDSKVRSNLSQVRAGKVPVSQQLPAWSLPKTRK
jgi:hypothetical protein